MAHQPGISGRCLGYRATQVLAYIRQATRADGQAPSYAMIRRAIGITSNGEVSRIVKALENRGLLCRTGRGRCRRIRLGE